MYMCWNKYDKEGRDLEIISMGTEYRTFCLTRWYIHTNVLCYVKDKKGESQTAAEH